MILQLWNPDHVQMVEQNLRALQLDPQLILGDTTTTTAASEPVTLSLKRTLSQASSTLTSHDGTTGRRTSKTTKNPNSPGVGGRLKSTCFINHHAVPLKALKAIGAPLLTLVDAPAAAQTLSRPPSRLAILDTALLQNGHGYHLLQRTRLCQNEYQQCRQARHDLERALQQHESFLPASVTAGQQDLTHLQHWIDELDVFEERVTKLVQSFGTGSELQNWDHDGEYEEEEEYGHSVLVTILNDLSQLSWMDHASDNTSPAPSLQKQQESSSSKLYHGLLDLSSHLKDLDQQMDTARQARESLVSLSSPTSAKTAVEQTRQLLMDLNRDSDLSSQATEAAEQVHSLLNELDNVLSECSQSLDDDNDQGLLSILKQERSSCPITLEELSEFVTEWNILARKHGISPHLLPSCHMSLRCELDGNLEAQTLLPQALKAEAAALQQLQESCDELSQARMLVAQQLSVDVTQRLVSSLGMRQSTFQAIVRPVKDVTRTSATVGVDEVDFYLFHNDNNSGNTATSRMKQNAKKAGQRGGKLESVASSGERARILLAIECSIPGSIRALSNGGVTLPLEQTLTDDDSREGSAVLNAPTTLPVAVIYDEIDAHVGGRASVAVAEMLTDQSKFCQVVSITHSPSVAATAGTHICVQKEESESENFTSALSDNEHATDTFSTSGSPLRARLVRGSDRLQELGRMASGDLATQEAKTFAEALIRHANQRKKQKNI
uniref:DNA repair protein RecN n=1 Tax=Entomoneis paludosa TaxID=265537 RepID=A0A7S3DWW3_9STRA|mmetsp:Transcript_6006/g.12655  ORF Transcript_6006/g.12655 Transcript_6006/m.12655 type:complete len:723 (+) Transcript_6006:138-2306(+)